MAITKYLEVRLPQVIFAELNAIAVAKAKSLNEVASEFMRVAFRAYSLSLNPEANLRVAEGDVSTKLIFFDTSAHPIDVSKVSFEAVTMDGRAIILGGSIPEAVNRIAYGAGKKLSEVGVTLLKIALVVWTSQGEEKKNWRILYEEGGQTRALTFFND